MPLCSACGKKPAVIGYKVCQDCLQQFRKQARPPKDGHPWKHVPFAVNFKHKSYKGGHNYGNQED